MNSPLFFTLNKSNWLPLLHRSAQLRILIHCWVCSLLWMIQQNKAFSMTPIRLKFFIQPACCPSVCGGFICVPPIQGSTPPQSALQRKEACQNEEWCCGAVIIRINCLLVVCQSMLAIREAVTDNEGHWGGLLFSLKPHFNRGMF